LIERAMSTLRHSPPRELADQSVEVSDLSDGIDLGSLGELPPTDAILITGETIKVVARPSGTEPKLKCYLEARVPTGERTVQQARRMAGALLEQLRREMSDALGIR